MHWMSEVEKHIEKGEDEFIFKTILSNPSTPVAALKKYWQHILARSLQGVPLMRYHFLKESFAEYKVGHFHVVLNQLMVHPNFPAENLPSIPLKDTNLRRAWFHAIMDAQAMTSEQIEEVVRLRLMENEDAHLSASTFFSKILSLPNASPEFTELLFQKGIVRYGTVFSPGPSYGRFTGLSDERRERIIEEKNEYVISQLASNSTLSTEHAVAISNMTLYGMYGKETLNHLNRLASNPATPPNMLASFTQFPGRSSVAEDIREVALGNPSTPLTAIERVYKKIRRSDSAPSRYKRETIVSNPNVSDALAMEIYDEDPTVRDTFFKSRSLPDQVWDYIIETIPNPDSSVCEGHPYEWKD